MYKIRKLITSKHPLRTRKYTPSSNLPPINEVSENPPTTSNSSEPTPISTDNNPIETKLPLPIHIDTPIPNNGQSLIFLGHSWVKRTRDNNYKVQLPPKLNSFDIQFHHAGYIDHAFTELHYIENKYPNLIILHLSANDLDKSPSPFNVRQHFEQLTIQIFQSFPYSKLIIINTESRFLSHKPSHEHYKIASNCFNVWLNRKITKGYLGDRQILIRGKNKLDNPDLYSRDGVHLNRAGQIKYLHIINSFLEKCVDCKNIPVGTPPLLVYCATPGQCDYCLRRSIKPIPTELGRFR